MSRRNRIRRLRWMFLAVVAVTGTTVAAGAVTAAAQAAPVTNATSAALVTNPPRWSIR